METECTNDETLNRKIKNLRKSLSTVDFNSDSPNLNLREARSFTGTLEEFKNSGKSQNPCKHDYKMNCQEHIYKEREANFCLETGYITKEVSSNQVFVVKDEMLTYRGKKYSLNDIATRWKKDCRMWLWKNKMSRMGNKSVIEIREKNQNCKMPNRSSPL